MNIHLFYSLGLFTVMLAAGGHAWAAPSTVDLLEEKGREAWSQLEELRKELIEKEDRRLSAYEIQVKLRTWMRGFTDNERDAFSKGLRKAAMEARVPGTVLEPIMHAFEALNTERLLRQEPMEEAENATGVIKTTDSPERKSRAAWRWLQGRDEKKVLSSREDLKAGLTAWMRDLAYNERPVFIRSLVEAAKRAGASEAVIATIKQALAPVDAERLQERQPTGGTVHATGVIQMTNSARLKGRAAWRLLESRSKEKLLSSEDIESSLNNFMSDLSDNERSVFVAALVEAAEKAEASKDIIEAIKQAP